MTKNLKNVVWLNGNNSLSYLILKGNYSADVPLVLPHQFVLVLDGARLDAVPNFPVTEKVPPHQRRGSTWSISVTYYALVVFKGVYFSAVVSPGGPSQVLYFNRFTFNYIIMLSDMKYKSVQF